MKRLAYFFILGIASQALVFSQAGNIDTTFGINGSIQYNDAFVVTSSLIQPDGKIIVTGYQAGIANAVMKRYNEDGSEDITFNFQCGITNPFSAAFGAKQQSDGKIIILTVIADDIDTGPFYLNVVRVNPDGSKDINFNSPLITADMSNEFLLFLGSDGKPGIFYSSNQSGTGIVTITKFLDSGEYDTSFGQNGEKQFAVYSNPPDPVSFGDMDNALIADDSGNFYFTFKIADNHYFNKTNSDFSSSLIQGYTTSDRKFTFYSNNAIYSAYGNQSEIGLQKFSASTLNTDNTYGINSTASVNISAGGSNNHIESRGLIQPDGKGVVVSAQGTDMYISRFMSDGNVDVDFGNNGVLLFTADFPTGYAMSALYSEPAKKLYILNVDEDNASFLMTRINLGETTLSVTDVNPEQQLLIYPNPTTDYIYLPENIIEITIINMSGRIISERKIRDKKLNLSNLDQGIYVIVAKDKESKIYHQKIIKK